MLYSCADLPTTCVVEGRSEPKACFWESRGYEAYISREHYLCRLLAMIIVKHKKNYTMVYSGLSHRFF